MIVLKWDESWARRADGGVLWTKGRAVRRDVREALERDSITVGPNGTIGMLGSGLKV